MGSRNNLYEQSVNVMGKTSKEYFVLDSLDVLNEELSTEKPHKNVAKTTKIFEKEKFHNNPIDFAKENHEDITFEAKNIDFTMPENLDFPQPISVKLPHTEFPNTEFPNTITPDFSNFDSMINNFLQFYDIFINGWLISILTIALFFILCLINKPYKSNNYLLLLGGLLSYIFIILTRKELYLNLDKQFLQNIIIFLMILLIVYLLILQETAKTIEIRFEYPILIIIAMFGILITLENKEGLLIFLGLEVQAFIYYTIVSLKDKEIFSAEGALKYFLIGAIASGLIILGLGLLYGQWASTDFVEIAESIKPTKNLLINLGGLIILLGLMFKIGGSPFHLWLPDAYQASPFYVLIFLIIFPKIALFHLIFILNNIFYQNIVIIFIIILTSIIGSVQAVVQTKIKRFLAYSIIYNNGFFLSITLLSSMNSYFSLMESIIIYLLITLTTALSFFAMKNSINKQLFLNLRDLISLKKSNVILSLILLCSFYSSAGIPPFLGFFQKYIILLSLTEKLQVFIVVFLILSAILPAYYYLRMSKLVYFLTQTKHILLVTINKLLAISISFLFMLNFGIFL